ncbi:MAG TPA: YceI family protein [Chloroflexia bacterium]|nr:YceI family protein [Chloroflexia bacterium]
MDWQLDYGHAYVGFSGRHLMVSIVRGEFQKFSGKVYFDEQDITRSTAEIEIEADSVATRNPDRDTHFRSADFFDVQNYPKIYFRSKKVVMNDAQHGQLTGDLTIRGITREVTLELEYSGVSQTPWNTLSAGFSLHGKVNRKDWGLNWNMVLAGGGIVASDIINLEINLELTKPVEVPASASTIA